MGMGGAVPPADRATCAHLHLGVLLVLSLGVIPLMHKKLTSENSRIFLRIFSVYNFQNSKNWKI
jgi:hypothetical protein